MPNPYAERHRHAQLAKDHLVRGAAALTELLGEEELAFALLQASLAILEIARADPEERALARVIACLERAKREAG